MGFGVGKGKIRDETGNTGQELEQPGITGAGTTRGNVGEAGMKGERGQMCRKVVNS